MDLPQQRRQQRQQEPQPIDTSLPRLSGPTGADYLQHHSPSSYAAADLASLLLRHPSRQNNLPLSTSSSNRNASPPKTRITPAEDGTATTTNTTFLDAARPGALPTIHRTFSLPLVAGATALHQAAAAGDLEGIRILLAQGAPLEARDELDQTPLLVAVRAGQVDAARELLSRGADASARAARATATPLLAATRREGEDEDVDEDEAERMRALVELLLQHGASLATVCGPERGNALHWAAAGGGVAAARLLLDVGADVEARDGRFRTPLMVAADAGRCGVVRVLLDAGADVEARSAKGSTALAWASSHGHVDAMRLLLERGASVDSLDDFGHSVLFLAANFGRPEAVKLLLERGAQMEMHSAPPEGLTALHAATGEGHADVVELLLRHGCDRDAKTFNGQTALDIAVEDGRRDVLEVLLRTGEGESRPAQGVAIQIALAREPDVLRAVVEVAAACFKALMGPSNSGDDGEFGWAKWVLEEGGPLILPAALRKLFRYALDAGDTKFVEWLIRHDAHPQTVRGAGATFLHHAVRNRDVDFMKLLLDAGVDPNLHVPEHLTPLDEAIRLLEKDPTDLEPFELLVKSGARSFRGPLGEEGPGFGELESGLDEIIRHMVRSVDAVDSFRDLDGRTLLHIAVLKDLREEVELLLRSGANVDALDGEGRSPLLYGCYSEPMTRLLLDKGANPKIASADGTTALHEAAEQDCVGGLVLLLDRGLDINAQDAAGNTPLHRALDVNAERAVMHLLAAGADVSIRTAQACTALHCACRTLAEPGVIIPELLQRGADLEARDEDGETPLLYAISISSAPVVRYLLDRGARFDVANAYNHTPLHMALGFGCQDIAMMLIAEGADVAAAGREQRTPLHLAAMTDQPHAASILLSKGAATEAADDTGATPLHVASACPGIVTFKLLLDAKANLDARDVDGWTPLHHAAENGHLQKVHLLLDAGADPSHRTTDDGLTPKERAELQGYVGLVKLFDDWAASQGKIGISSGDDSTGAYQETSASGPETVPSVTTSIPSAIVIAGIPDGTTQAP